MEARNRLTHHPYFALLIAAVIFSGCASAKKSPESGTPPSAVVQGEAEIYGPPKPQAPDTYGPEKIHHKTAVLVFGPGMAEGFVHAGVLRALKDAKISVGAVLGTEMGSLIAAIYSLDENANRLEWALHRFDEQAFSGGGLLSGIFKGPGSGSKLRSELQREFSKRDISQSKIPLRVMFESDGAPVIASRGGLIDALRGALADPKLLEAGEWQGAKTHASKTGVKSLLKEARSMGLGPVIYVHAESGALPEGLDADLILRPDVKGIQRTDFNKRATAIARGRLSAKAQIETIRGLTGASK